MPRPLPMILLLAVFVAVVGPVRASDSTIVERAFTGWVERAGMASVEEVLVSQVPCGSDVCMQFQVPEVPRARILVQIVEVAAGFGFGADVVRANMMVDHVNPEMASVTIVTRQQKGGPDAGERMQMANNNMALLRVAAGLHESGEFPSDLRHIARGTAFYYIAGIVIEQTHSSLHLVAPPGAPPPAPAHRIEGAPGCYCIPHPASGETRQTGYFARWQTFSLRCNWVCTPASKPLE